MRQTQEGDQFPGQQQVEVSKTDQWLDKDFDPDDIASKLMSKNVGNAQF